MTDHIFCDDKNVWTLTIKICHYKNIEFDNDNVLYILTYWRIFVMTNMSGI